MRVVPILLALAGAARAEPVQSLPGEESGRLDEPEHDGVLRVLGRGVLLVPRGLVELINLPGTAGLYVYDRYHVDELYNKAFYFHEHRYGILPAITFESGFGASLGVKLVGTDLFGAQEHALAQATTGAVFGEPYREGVRVGLDSGERFTRAFKISFAADFDRRPDDPFYGLGNGDLHRDLPAMPIDARTNETAYETYHRYQEERAALTVDVKPDSWLHFAATGALTDLSFSESDQGPPLTSVYAANSLVGYLGGVRHAYVGLEARVDTRAASTRWEPPSQYTQGSLVAVYGGRVDRLDGGVDYFRYGAEAQHFFRLAAGPRVLVARIRADGVSASRDEVPFTEFPMLGGGDFLRGYDYGRFRDRAAAFASLQYEWDLSHFVSAYVFTDAGRVWDAFEDATLRGLRVGYGVGFEARGEQGFLAGLQLASSIDGGFLVSVAFNQVVDARPRWR